MTKIIITGATGFVGSSLTKFLLDKKKFEIYLIVREGSNLLNINSIMNSVHIFTYNGELNNLIEYFQEVKPDIIFHLASSFIAEHESNQINSLIESNITFGLHLLEAMKVSETKKIINTGTSWQHYNNEDYNPVCLYAATKQAFEALIEYYVQADGFKVITLKLFDTYGENDHRPKLINLLDKFANEQTELNMTPGKQQISLVHISDVCEAFYLASKIINNDDFLKSKSYAIRGEIDFNLKQVVQIFEDVSSKKLNINWGNKLYRKREVMKLWQNCEILPNWQPKISLREGLVKILNKNFTHE